MEFLFSTRLQAEGLQLYQKYTLLQVFSKVLLRFVAIYDELFDISGTFISPSICQQRLLTVVRVSKYSFPKLQHIFRAGDYGLRKPKMLNVSTENLIFLKWLNIYVISNIKFNGTYSKTCPSSLLYIQQRRIQNPIRRLRQSFSRKELTAFIRQLFSKKAPSQMFDRVLNTLLFSEP